MIAKAFCVVVVVATGMLVGTPLIAAEPAGRLPRIGVLWPGLVDQWNQAFHQGLRENGYVDGTTAVVDRDPSAPCRAHRQHRDGWHGRTNAAPVAAPAAALRRDSLA